MKVEELGEVRASEVAKLFGVTARRVQQLTQDGIITPASEGAGGKRCNICAVTQQYIAFLSGKSTGSSFFISDNKTVKQSVNFACNFLFNCP